LGDIKQKYNLPVTTDVHESYQPALLADVVDIIQIPAYLCRQTDLLVASAKTGRIVNIKKGQFLSGADMKFAAQKVAENNNNQIILTERGNMFGYNNLIIDYRNLPEMKKLGYPVMMDCTHSVQRPGGNDGTTGGNREFIPQVAKAAKIFGADGFFLEVHPDPTKALSDSTNQLYLADLEQLIKEIMNLPV
jgi:2-dehydro-3-deoxyphosphooctonate aldolase (KDO 8-P synthase)